LAGQAQHSGTGGSGGAKAFGRTTIDTRRVVAAAALRTARLRQRLAVLLDPGAPRRRLAALALGSGRSRRDQDDQK